MKIGEFAKKHNVSVDTVRHYINEGLLTPLRENTQFNFSEIDDRVMDSILLLKSMNFKLEEMKTYLLFQTLFTNNTFAGLGCFRSVFEEKLEENRKIITELESMNARITEHLNQYGLQDYHRGLPLSMLSDLVCPDCGEALTLEDAKILHNEIMEGQLLCPHCQLTYHVHYGILSDKPVTQTENLDDVAPSLEQYVKTNDADYIVKLRELFQKGVELSDVAIQNAKNILVDGDSCSFATSAVLRMAPKDAKVFICLPNNLSVKCFMEDFFPPNTLLYYGDITRVPLRTSMDFVFQQDYDMMHNLYGEYHFYPHIRPGAFVLSSKAYIFSDVRLFHNEQQFLQEMNRLGFQLTESYHSGHIINRQDSPDLDIIKKCGDLEMEYALYTFKTLG
ncbi:MAG: MerR family transcriptional regulator [Lachnospiraceae bacterium]|nr:MerR family transcriptional regulator [Lachnospiraceae bacterium]